MTSTARVEANRKNSLRSTGPRTPEGKARSRRNGLKHGLTGAFVVLPGDDGPAIAERVDAWSADFRPSNRAESWLVERAAVASVRLDRCVRRECATLAELVAGAGDEWDRARRDGAHRAAADILTAPAAAVAALNRTAAGLDWLIGRWENVQAQARSDGMLPLPILHYVLRLMGVSRAPLATDGDDASTLWGMGLGAMDEMLLAPNEAYHGLSPEEGATIEVRSEAVHALIPDEAVGPDGLLACIASQIAGLNARRSEVWEFVDGPARPRCSIGRGSTPAPRRP